MSQVDRAAAPTAPRRGPTGTMFHLVMPALITTTTCGPIDGLDLTFLPDRLVWREYEDITLDHRTPSGLVPAQPKRLLEIQLNGHFEPFGTPWSVQDMMCRRRPEWVPEPLHIPTDPDRHEGGWLLPPGTHALPECPTPVRIVSSQPDRSHLDRHVLHDLEAEGVE